eukprot:scaffold28988_cov73-Phaeocystis_antarctica.AAC.1
MVRRPEQGLVQVAAPARRARDLLAGHQLNLGAQARSVVLAHVPRHAPGNVGDALPIHLGVRAHAVPSGRLHVVAHLPLQVPAGLVRVLEGGRRWRDGWLRRPSHVSAAPCGVPQLGVLAARVGLCAVAEGERLGHLPARLRRPNQVVVQIAASVTCHHQLQDCAESRPTSLAARSRLSPGEPLEAGVEQHRPTTDAWQIAAATRDRGVVAHAPHRVLGDKLIAAFGRERVLGRWRRRRRGWRG